jgi:hypothetical protein
VVPGTPSDARQRRAPVGAVEVVSKVTKEPQGDPTLIRLDPGVTVSQLLAAASGDPNNIALIASIVFSPQANKGSGGPELISR